MPASPTPSLLSALRVGTRDLHDRTEVAFVLAGPDVSRDAYVAVLAHLAAYSARAEAALAPWAPALAALGLDLAARRKAPLLRRDLAALGARRDAAPAGAALAAERHDRPLPSAAAALGTLYVLEGATLGGQLLRRRLGPALGLTAASGLAFFTAYGAEVGPMWKAFGLALERFDAATPEPARPAAHAAAVAGARAAFLAFERDVVAPTASPARPRLPALAAG